MCIIIGQHGQHTERTHVWSNETESFDWCYILYRNLNKEEKKTFIFLPDSEESRGTIHR